MSDYTNDIAAAEDLCKVNGSSWNAINPESVARMRAQNKFKHGLASLNIQLILCVQIWPIMTLIRPNTPSL